MTVAIEDVLVLFEFSSDDMAFRHQLFMAIDARECPDYARSLGGTGRNWSGLWRPEHAEGVRTWARSIGAEIRSRR